LLAFRKYLNAASDHASVDRVYVTTLRRWQLAHILGLWQLIRVIDHACVAALRLDQLLELFERLSALQVPLHGLLGRQGRTRHARQANNFHAQLQHEFLQVVWSLALEKL